ncbi:MAG: excinuclease ABC subunit UvrC [Candidatus Kerfeldbacteria bacterium]|nr:excinuclease ABC subunit UvrC [Candidatus Kerfeldbacteria bacterium]
MPTTAKFRSALTKLPRQPGVYLFKDDTDAVLYVGKAKSLKPRVRSYFQRSASLDPAKRVMVNRVADLEYIIVDSEIEALLLESTLIKKYRPPYNVIFTDDKYYQYIRLTLKDDFPRVDTVRRITKDGSRYFGPFTSNYALKQTLKLLKRIFPFRSCTEPADRLCFDARLGRCLGHDFGPNSRQRYADVIRGLIRFLEGDVTSTLRDLKQEMQEAAAKREFELAARLRDRVYAIQKVVAEQKVVSTKLENEDYLGLARVADLTTVVVFQVRLGKLLNRSTVMLQHTEGTSDTDVLASFISQYYAQSTDHPRTVVTRLLPTDSTTLGRALQLRIEAPNRGRRRKLVRLAESNAKDYLERKQREWLSKEARAKLGLAELQHALLLTEPPDRIECYDISNVQGTNAVGSLVVFERGLPKKSDYKKFRIKTVAGANDYAMLQEVLKRRFEGHSPPPRESGDRGRDTAKPRGGVAKRQEGWENPDLIIIDGGKGQLNASLVILRNLRISIPTIGLAKREEEIFRPGQKDSIKLSKDSEGLFLVQRIRDEAHRFAIGYYRKRHGTATTTSLLDEVPGIGPTTKRLLLQRFGSIEHIRAAEDAVLEELIGKKRTELLRQYL